jgi:hypothetical protein
MLCLALMSLTSARHACGLSLRDLSTHLKNLQLNITTSKHIFTFYPNVMHLNHITICFIIDIRQLVNGKMCFIHYVFGKEKLHPLRFWKTLLRTPCTVPPMPAPTASARYAA